MNILCFGDSNTYGHDPVSCKRHPRSIRWTGVLQELLGSEHFVIESGFNGRTTVFEDPEKPYRRGDSLLPYEIKKNMPLDLVIIMLGTNDCKEVYQATPQIIANGVRHLVQQIRQLLAEEETVPEILVVSPVHIKHFRIFTSFNAESIEKSQQLYPAYQRELGSDCRLVNAAEWAQASEKDGVHMDAENHRRFAEKLAEWIQSEL